MNDPSPHFKAQSGHRRVKLGEVRVVLTVSVAFNSDFLESGRDTNHMFEPHLTCEISATLLAFHEVSILLAV